MPKFVFLGLGIATLLFFTAATARAQAEEEQSEEEVDTKAATEVQTAYGAERGGYVGLSGFVGFDTSSGDLKGETDDGGGIAARVGFRVYDPLAVELQGEYFSGLEDIEGWSITVNLRLYPLEFWRENPGRFQIYTFIGGGVMGGFPGSSVAYQLEGAFRFGGGFNYYFIDQLALDIGGDWTTARGELEDVNYGKAAIGLQFNF